MTKTVAYTALLYGRDYLGEAIRSVIDCVQEYHVIFDQFGHGSHGSYTEVSCPDTRNQLYDIAIAAAGNKLHWHDAGPFAYEGQQRDAIHTYSPDADVILVLDADEIWAKDLAHFAISSVLADPDHRTFRLPIIHYWRSFRRAILHDPAFPVRVIAPKHPDGGDATLHPFDPHQVISHLGYAQRSEIVAYKLLTHGHRGEFRRDCNWFQDRFMANAQQDCHPVGSDYWNPESVDPLIYMPEWMQNHPCFSMELIP